MDARMDDGWLRIPAKSRSGGKKQAKNPFYFFMQAKKKQWLAEGTWDERKPMNKLAEACHPIWAANKTNPKFLAPYMEEAWRWQFGQHNDLERTYDSLGRPLAAIQREVERVRQARHDMETEIEQKVRGAGRKPLALEFHVAHFNYLCKTDRDFYIPCEVAIAKFSLEKGVIGLWSEFIAPLDSIPVGYTFKCLQYSRETHQLTKDFEHFVKDYKQILRKIEEQLGGTAEKMPPLYVMPDHMEAANCITNFILTKAESKKNIKIYCLTKLLQELGRYDSSHVAQSLIEEDPYSHNPGIGCPLHEVLENSVHCALSIAQRRVFTVIHHCADLYRLQLLPGKHLPPDTFPPPSLADRAKFSKANVTQEKRINRKIPNPGGVTNVPSDFNENILKQLHKDEDAERAVKKIERPKAASTLAARLEGMRLGAIPKHPFSSVDIRQKPTGGTDN